MYEGKDLLFGNVRYVLGEIILGVYLFRIEFEGGGISPAFP